MRNPPALRRIIIRRPHIAGVLIAGTLTLLFTGTAFLVMRSVWSSLENQAAGRIVDAVAAAATTPEIAGRMIDALTGEPDSRDIRRGRELLSRYGYDADTVVLLDPVLSRRNLLSIIAAVAVLMTGTLVSVVFLVALRRVFSQVDAMAAVAERIAGGRYSLEPAEMEEGSLGRLRHQISQMAHRLAEQVTLVQSEKEKLRRFLSDISHQLKTPLASTRMFQELLLELEEPAGGGNSAGAANTGRRREFLSRSLHQLDRMEWLVRNLLTVARMEAGSFPMQFETSALAPTVTETAGLFQDQARQATVDLRVSAENPSVAVRHDPRWLGEALSNLIKNGLEHTPPGGKVTVTLHWTSLFARIVVEDSGEGITAQDIPHLFERFYQGSSTRSKSGTGIGLALAKAIVERHQGYIAVEPASSTGARFIVILPRNLTKP